MDPVSATIGFGIGVASIASIFQTCLHGYRSLNTAMAIGNTALTLNVQFRVEELRLYLWGRNWGLVGETKGTDDKPTQKAKPDADDSDKEVEPPNDDGNPESIVSEKQADLLDTVDDELEIPGLRDLTIEVLGRIQKALEEWKRVGERYGAATPARVQKGGKSDAVPTDSSDRLLSKVSSKQAGQEKEISDRNKFSAKLRWAVKDKAVLDELLMKLTSLNDSLEKLLPRRERTSLARGLAGELLNLLESGAKDPETDIREQLAQLVGQDEVKAARIVGLKHINQTEMAERTSKDKEKPSAADGPSPFNEPSVWTGGVEGNMQIPFDDFVKLAEPKITYYQVQGDYGQWVTGKYAPLPRSIATYAPLASTPNVATTTRASSGATGVHPTEGPAQVTLIEWRPTAHESRASELSEKDLKDRRDHIARLLHRTSVTDVDFRILDCLGYTTAAGHTPDGSTHDLVGYVYRYPDFASPKRVPVSLRVLLGQAYYSDEPNVPSLEERFKLAQNLAIALYQLQCAGWVHRKVSSYNVIFFTDRMTGQLDLGRPFLVGWQYSRPDDQRKLYPSESASKGIGDLDMYVHRRRLHNRGARRFPRFRKSFDMYSLGVILMEIAFWEPIIALASEEEREKMEKFEDVDSGGRAEDWWKAISKTARKEIAAEMGIAYQDAVLFCLEGSSAASVEEFNRLVKESYGEDGDSQDKYFDDANFEEVGIEKEFYWRVLKTLDRFGM